ncbi:hypothetical protein [Catellatospora methionotrophica]|uniref:hypothetical protein n=1 Tax=Catellatospora methionotrophica TaxID=121620 RepID=UPI0033E4E520
MTSAHAAPAEPVSATLVTDDEDALTGVIWPERDHPMYAGHYPGFAILPGAYLLDATDRLMRASRAAPGTTLAEVVSCRFKAPVRPGEAVAVRLRLDRTGPEVRCEAQLSTVHGPVAVFVLAYRHRAAADTERPDRPRVAVPDAGPVAGRDAITGIIPHRPPVLLVDEVTEVEPRRSLTARYRVTGDEPWGAGEPELAPGLAVESFAQAALLLMLWEDPNPDVTRGSVALAGQGEAIALPGRARRGDVIEHRVQVVRRFGDTAIFKGTSTVDDKVIMEVSRLMAGLRPAEQLIAARDERGTP